MEENLEAIAVAVAVAYGFVHLHVVQTPVVSYLTLSLSCRVKFIALPHSEDVGLRTESARRKRQAVPNRRQSIPSSRVDRSVPQQGGYVTEVRHIRQETTLRQYFQHLVLKV